MSDVPFHQTRMGHVFYEGTMPGLVRELARLNTNLERLLAAAEGQRGTVPSGARTDPEPEEDR